MKALLTTLALVVSSYSLAQTSFVLHTKNQNNPLEINLIHISTFWETYNTTTQDTTLFFYNSPPGLYLLIASPDGIRKDTAVVLLPPNTQSQYIIHWKSDNTLALLNLPGEFQFQTQQFLDVQPTEAMDAVRNTWGLGPIVPATTSIATGPHLTYNGQDPLYSRYTVDGFDNTDQYWGGQRNRINLSSLTGIGVSTGQAPIRFGQAGNGLVRMETESGLRRDHLSIYGITMPNPLIASNQGTTQSDLAGNPRMSLIPRYQGGISWSGNIIPQKTFFMVNASYLQETTSYTVKSDDLGVDTTLSSANRYLWLAGRVDQRWTNQFTTSLSVMGNIDTLDLAGSLPQDSIRFVEANLKKVQNAFALGIRNTYQGKDYSASLNYQYSLKRGFEALNSLSDAPTVFLYNPVAEQIAILGGYPTQEHSYRSHQWQANYARSILGHQVEFGAEVMTTRYLGLSGGNPNGTYEVQVSSTQLADLQGYGLGLSYEDIPNTGLVRRYVVGLNYGYVAGSQTVYRLFVEDQFSLWDRLFVTAGLAWEYDQITRGAHSIGDLNNVAPQVIGTYQLSDNTALRGAAGLYYNRLPYAINDLARSNSSQGTHFRRQLEVMQRLGVLNPDADVNDMTYEGAIGLETGAGYLNGPTAEDLGPNSDQQFTHERYILNPDGWDSPMVLQTSVALEHHLQPNTLISLSASYHEGYHQLRLIDINAPSSYSYLPDSIVARDPMVADATRPIPIRYDAFGPYMVDIDGAILREPSRRIMMHDSKGRYRYMGLTLSASHQPTNHWLAYWASYTLSRHLSTVPQGWQIPTNTNETTWAPSNQDRTHILTGLINASPWEFLGLTLQGIAQSGQPYTLVASAEDFGTTDLDGDGSPIPDPYPGSEINQYRLPWSYTVNGSVRIKAMLGRNYIMVEGSVFNLLNRANYSGYFGYGLLENQMLAGNSSGAMAAPTQTSAPLRGQIMLKVGF